MPHLFTSHQDFKEWFSNPLTGMIEGSQEYNENIVKRLHKVTRLLSLTCKHARTHTLTHSLTYLPLAHSPLFSLPPLSPPLPPLSPSLSSLSLSPSLSPSLSLPPFLFLPFLSIPLTPSLLLLSYSSLTPLLLLSYSSLTPSLRVKYLFVSCL